MSKNIKPISRTYPGAIIINLSKKLKKEEFDWIYFDNNGNISLMFFYWKKKKSCSVMNNT